MDKAKFIGTFKAEADELIIKLQNGFIELEKNPDNPPLIQELNRAAHTLKGAARMMGFNSIQDEAHAIEEAFALIGKGEGHYGPETATAVLRRLDQIKALEEQVLAKFTAPPPPAEGERPDAPAGTEPAPSLIEQYIKVPLSRIDQLVNLVGETIVSKSKAAYKGSGAKKLANLTREHYKKLALLAEKNHSAELHDLSRQADQIQKEVVLLGESIATEASHLDPLIAEMQEKAREMRMLPASTVLDNFPRLVRDLAAAQQKEVELVIEGGETEIDKKVLEEINQALIHLLRNAVDHGIEQKGRIRLAARHEGGSILIEVEDDGKGIDLERVKETALKKKLTTPAALEKLNEKEVLNFIFLPGFSTSSIITDISGRGVGMDVVKTQVEKVRGQVKVETAPGKGTKFTLKLPLTIAIIRSVFVRSCQELFALPLLAVDETLEIAQQEINSIEGKLAFTLRGGTLPLIDLGRLLGLPLPAKPTADDGSQKIPVVVVSSLEKKLGLIVDQIVGEEEIYIKPLGGYLEEQRNIEGGAIIGTGEVVVVLDVPDLIESAGLKQQTVASKGEGEKEERKKKILIAEDSFTTRELEKSILEAQGYEVETAVDGLDALDHLSKNRPDLIVSDIQMPRLDGFELCRTVKQSEQLKEIPVVMVTALEKDEDKRRGIEVGADAYITKGSFEQKNLLETIARLIG